MSAERVREALILSDLHLGWASCYELHARLLDRLHEAPGDAELIVLNGDIVDVFRQPQRRCDRELVLRLMAQLDTWRSEGRRVVFVEGNHDPGHGKPDIMGVLPDCWCFDFVGHHGERIRVIHGHQFSDTPPQEGRYVALGKVVLPAENKLLSKHTWLRRTYGLGHGWLVGAVGLGEDVLWFRQFPARVRPLLAECDVLVYGHYHFGKAHGKIDNTPIHRSGAWVSRGHLGSVDRMLRYRAGRFERLGLTSRGFVPMHDGR